MSKSSKKKSSVKTAVIWNNTVYSNKKEVSKDRKRLDTLLKKVEDYLKDNSNLKMQIHDKKARLDYIEHLKIFKEIDNINDRIFNYIEVEEVICETKNEETSKWFNELKEYIEDISEYIDIQKENLFDIHVLQVLLKECDECDQDNIKEFLPKFTNLIENVKWEENYIVQSETAKILFFNSNIISDNLKELFLKVIENCEPKNNVYKQKETLAHIYTMYIENEYNKVKEIYNPEKIPDIQTEYFESRNFKKEILEVMKEVYSSFPKVHKEITDFIENIEWENNKKFIPSKKVYNFKMGKKLILNSVEVLGANYQNILKMYLEKDGYIHKSSENFKELENYCRATKYDLPYIHIEYNNDLDSLSTLAHELGHAMDFMGLKPEEWYIAINNDNVFVNETIAVVNQMLLYFQALKNAAIMGEKNFYNYVKKQVISEIFFSLTEFISQFDFQENIIKMYENSNNFLDAQTYEEIYKNSYFKFVNSEEPEIPIENRWIYDLAYTGFKVFENFEYLVANSVALQIAKKLFIYEDKEFLNKYLREVGVHVNYTDFMDFYTNLGIDLYNSSLYEENVELVRELVNLEMEDFDSLKDKFKK